MITKKTYSIRQQLLYTVCVAAWNLCLRYRDSFAAFKAFYTEAFINAQLKEIAAAEALPALLQSNNQRTDARIDLLLASKIVMQNWQSLKAYIEHAFIPEKVEAMLEAAGSSLYKKAGQGNWDGTRSLITAASTFIANYEDVLVAKDNMPDSFAAKFQADADACTGAATTYADTEMAKEKATNDKVDANNIIYASLVRLCRDAGNVFMDQPVIKKQFTVRNLVAVNSSEGVASLTGYIKNESNMPLENAVITAADTQYGAVTNDKGRYSIGRISAVQTYTFTISAKGYQPVSKIITLTPGTASRANFTLISELVPVS